MVVSSCRPVARDIREFTLRPADPADAPLPGFEPGAHITVQTPSGAMRRYSLVNDGTDPQEYVIAVKREQGSRGGSASMHDAVEAGTRAALVGDLGLGEAHRLHGHALNGRGGHLIGCHRGHGGRHRLLD